MWGLKGTMARKKLTETLMEVFESWGLKHWTHRSAPEAHSRDVLVLYLPREGQQRLTVGHLREAERGYVFAYHPEFKATGLVQPLPGFPDLDEEYECERLPPFFRARLPPIDRPDVQKVLSERQIDRTDLLKVLAAVSGRAVANPYVLELEQPKPGPRRKPGMMAASL